MHDLTGFQRDSLVASAGLDGPEGLDVTRERGRSEGERDHGHREQQDRHEWERDRAEITG